MLDYTKSAGLRVWRNIKIASFVMNVLAQIASILYLTYILWTGSGLFPLNLTLLVLSSIYFCFFSFTAAHGVKNALTKRVRIAFRWSKRLIKLFNLGILVYGFVCAKAYTPLSLLMTAFLLFFWVIDLLLEIVAALARAWGGFMFEAIKADVEKIAAPVTATKNFFKKITGKEVEEKPEPTKNRVILDKLVEERRQERKNQALEEKFLKAEGKRKEKEARQTAKRKRKEEKKAKKTRTAVDEAAITEVKK